MDRNLARGLFLAVIALAFGLGALRYPIGSFSHAGAGLFPLMMSALLLLIAVLTIVRARFAKREPLELRWRNIGLILLGLAAFAVASHVLNMTAGIVVMVVIVSLASGKPSWSRIVKLCLGLLAIAFAFQKLLGLNLPLY